VLVGDGDAILVPEGWPSGVYLAKLTEEREKLQSYMIFVVRDDRKCDFLFQCSDTTWAAYNRWPDLCRSMTTARRRMTGTRAPASA